MQSAVAQPSPHVDCCGWSARRRRREARPPATSVDSVQSPASTCVHSCRSINQQASLCCPAAKKTLAFHRLFSRVVLSTSNVHQDMFSTFHVNLDQLIPSQLTSSLINRNSGISGKGFYSYMHFLLINQQCCSTLWTQSTDWNQVKSLIGLIPFSSHVSSACQQYIQCVIRISPFIYHHQMW